MKKTLSKRETQILKLLLAEYKMPDIARLLDLSPSRVHDVKRIIFEKWEVETMVGLTKEGIKRGFLELENDDFETSESVNNTPTYVYSFT